MERERERDRDKSISIQLDSKWIGSNFDYNSNL